MSGRDLADEFGQFAATTTYERLPGSVVEAMKRLLVNSVAISLGGQSATSSGGAIRFAQSVQVSEGSTVLGTALAAPAPYAAFVNAMTGNAHDFDDNFDISPVHVGVTVTSTALAVAEARGGVSGRDFLAALAVGTDLICRVAWARTAENATEHEWNSTAIGSYPACSATAAKLLGLSEAEIRNAIALGCQMASGTKQSLYDGRPKSLIHGNASMAAINAALLSECGVEGPINAMDGRSGLFPVYYEGRYDRSRALEDLGSRYLGAEVSLKPYPCCRFSHGYVEGALDLLEREQLQVADLERVALYVCERNRIVWDPVPAKERPRTLMDAQFSVRFAVAAALVHGEVTFAQFSEDGIRDDAVLQLIPRIELVEEPNPPQPGMPPTTIEVTTTDGRTYRRTIEHYRGHPDNPMSYEEVVAKLRECATYATVPPNSESIDRFVDAVAHLEDLDDVSGLPKLLAGDRP